MSEAGTCKDCGATTDLIHYRGWSSLTGYFTVWRCVQQCRPACLREPDEPEPPPRRPNACARVI